jgi:hypothetical protein
MINDASEFVGDGSDGGGGTEFGAEATEDLAQGGPNRDGLHGVEKRVQSLKRDAG